MTYSMSGYIGDVAYTAVVDAKIAEQTPGAVGCVTGSPNILDLLKAENGEDMLVTVTGPLITLDVEDEKSVAGALYSLTRVVEVTGDAPALWEDAGPGAVY